jgi:nucleotide-binding universal stress UspA family protein
MKNILVPTDFSELSDFAFDLANKIARASGAKIRALKVIEAPGDTLFDKEGNLLECSEYDVTALKLDASDAEINMKEWLDTKSSEATGKVRIGHWYDLILDEAIKCDCDLIVMGAEYATGIKENLRATVADRIVRKSPVPVMTLKCDRGDMELRKIVLAGDFRAPAKAEIESLQILQSSFAAELHLLKVNTEKDFETQRQVLERMEKFAEINDLHVSGYHVYCDRGVEQGIVNFCDDYEMDILAIGKHDRSDLSHLFRGSKAEDVVNHVFKPILTFKI